jgi:hypothetical protein
MIPRRALVAALALAELPYALRLLHRQREPA